MRAFWERATAEQAEYGYYQASCFLADWLAEIGFAHDYGDGVYATSEKGRYWVEHPFNGDDPFLQLAYQLSTDQLPWADRVIYECTHPLDA